MAYPIIDNNDGGAKYLGRLWDTEHVRYVMVIDEPNGLFNAIEQVIGPMPRPPSEDVESDMLTTVNHDAGGNAITTYSFDPLPGQLLSARAQEYNTLATVWVARMQSILAAFVPSKTQTKEIPR